MGEIERDEGEEKKRRGRRREKDDIIAQPSSLSQKDKKEVKINGRAFFV